MRLWFLFQSHSLTSVALHSTSKLSQFSIKVGDNARNDGKNASDLAMFGNNVSPSTVDIISKMVGT